MYDEDRQTALTMYERMFDETADEQGLLQLLVSPTRQAVILARSYDAKERKLQMQSQSVETDYATAPEDAPAFIFVIDKVAQQAEELGIRLPPVSEDQFSIFDEVEAEAAVAPEEEAEEEEDWKMYAQFSGSLQWGQEKGDNQCREMFSIPEPRWRQRWGNSWREALGLESIV